MKKSFYLRLCDDRCVVFSKPAIMGIINVSPNSFYNPHLSIDAALRTAEKMVGEGADILDIGGEATNPFIDIETDSPSVQIELDRLLPVIEAIKRRFSILISVDTSRPVVMREAIGSGADIINDQRALSLDGALITVSDLKTPICLMHFPSRTCESNPLSCSELLASIKKELEESVWRCREAGILEDRIVIDPGFGQGHYSKNLMENFYLLNHLSQFVAMGFPVLSGWSRKSMIGDVLNQPAAIDRLYGSIAADVLAAYKGASIIRTHDVQATWEGVKITLYALECE